MAVKLPNGVLYSLSTEFDPAINITALSNANPAVAQANGHGLADGDIGVLTSGWSRINDRVFRVDDSDTNTFEVEGANTTSTTLFPARSGTGSIRPVKTFTQITQVMECTTNGGEMQFANYSFLENDFETQIPTQASAMSLQLTIADDPNLAGYAALKAAAETRSPYVLKCLFPDNSVIYYNGYVSFNETPVMTKNQVMTVQATFSLMSRPVRYAS